VAEEKARQAQDEIYRFKGEAEHVRRKLGEVSVRVHPTPSIPDTDGEYFHPSQQLKAQELLEQTTKKKIAEMQDNIDEQKMKHMKDMEAYMTAQAFKAS
jgi:hypothetical protein